jgi:hypothetical protein
MMQPVKLNQSRSTRARKPRKCHQHWSQYHSQHGQYTAGRATACILRGAATACILWGELRAVVLRQRNLDTAGRIEYLSHPSPAPPIPVTILLCKPARRCRVQSGGGREGRGAGGGGRRGGWGGWCWGGGAFPSAYAPVPCYIPAAPDVFFSRKCTYRADLE